MAKMTMHMQMMEAQVWGGYLSCSVKVQLDVQLVRFAH